jgi:hypothetical protein
MGVYLKVEVTKDGKTKEITAYHGGVRGSAINEGVLRRQLQAAHPKAIIGKIRPFDPTKDGEPPVIGVVTGEMGPGPTKEGAAQNGVNVPAKPPADVQPLPSVEPLPI